MRKETSRDFQSSVDTIVRVFVVSKKEDMFLEWNKSRGTKLHPWDGDFNPRILNETRLIIGGKEKKMFNLRGEF